MRLLFAYQIGKIKNKQKNADEGFGYENNLPLGEPENTLTIGFLKGSQLFKVDPTVPFLGICSKQITKLRFNCRDVCNNLL